MSRKIRNAAAANTPLFPSIVEQTEHARTEVMKYWEALRGVDRPKHDPVLRHVDKIVSSNLHGMIVAGLLYPIHS